MKLKNANFHIVYIITLLTIILIIKTSFFIINNIYLSYDETIVNNIAEQSVTSIFETIQAEPHPPLYYLILKVVHIFLDTDLKIKISLFIISYLLTVLIIIKHRKLIIKEKLYLGLGIYFISYAYIYNLSFIRHEILSFPLALLILLNIYNYVNLEDKKHISRNILVTNLLLILLFLLSYINYSFLILYFLLVVFFNKLYKQLFYTTLIQASVLFSYLFLFGYSQYLNNIGRFDWMEYDLISIKNTFGTFLITPLIDYQHSLIGNMFFVVMLLFIIISHYKKNSVERRTSLPVILLILILFFTGYYFDIFVRSRYLIIPMLIICFEFSRSLINFLNIDLNNVTIKLYFLFFPLLMINLIGFLHTTYHLNNLSRLRSNIIMDLPKDQNYNLLDAYNLSGHIFYLSVLSDNMPNNIHPLNLFNPLKQNTNISKDLLQSESKSWKNDTSIEMTEKMLNSYENYILLLPLNPLHERMAMFSNIKIALEKRCLNIKQNSEEKLIIYEACN